MKGLVAAFALALALVPAASGSQAAKTYRFRVVSVTHHSSSQKTESAPYYTGSSTSTWHLVAATRKAPNRISVTTGGFYSGGGMINVKGTFTAAADSQFGGHPNHCQLSASTGSTQYPAVAPHRFPVTIATDFSSPRRALVGIGPGGDVYASLSNGYFGAECSTDVSGEPDNDVTHLKSVPKSLFTHRLVTLKFAGSTNKDGIAYSWSTVIKLKRIVPRHR